MARRRAGGHLADGAADAAVHHLDDLLVGLDLGVLGEEGVVDPHLSELVLDDRQLLAVVLREDVVEQRRLAGACAASSGGSA
jgi:hypothetical protein